ncbi:formate hydrogenlyase subunit 3 [Escherichia coli]|uniref:Formate hydrogenlyase subunit 3 n=1 Tax=Escherichia coli TaxID=562 RepID=A0A484YY75_ECOLX|nr:formate hydrogenlyase subunit 3 [Escherichia coli]
MCKSLRLNAIWLITLGLCGLFVSLYNIDWHRHAQVKCNGLQINMLMAAAVCAVIASNLGMFVVMPKSWPCVRCSSPATAKRANCGLRWGVLGTLLLAIACWLLWQRYGTLDLRLLDMRMQQLPLGSDIWLLGVIGFGLLAGIIPLHGWVATGTCQRLCASCRAVFHGSHENWPAGHFNSVHYWAVMHRCGGGSRCWCSV